MNSTCKDCIQHCTSNSKLNDNLGLAIAFSILVLIPIAIGICLYAYNACLGCEEDRRDLEYSREVAAEDNKRDAEIKIKYFNDIDAK